MFDAPPLDDLAMLDAPLAQERQRAGRPDPMRAGPALAAAPGGSALLGAVLDEIDYGVMVVDAASGALLHANRLAYDEAQAHRTLDLCGGRVVATDPSAQRALAAALAGAGLGRRSLVTLRAAVAARDGGEAPRDAVPVSVVPLGVDGGPVRALLVFGKRQVADPLSVGFFARAHALTPTEDAVLLSLCRGLKPTQIAADHGVAISTVRTHVNSIRVKTGTSSIRELVNRVSTLPPMASALRRCTR